MYLSQHTLKVTYIYALCYICNIPNFQIKAKPKQWQALSEHKRFHLVLSFDWAAWYAFTQRKFFKIYVDTFFINQNISEIEAECQSFYESSCLVTGTNSYKRDILFTFLKILLIKFLT